MLMKTLPEKIRSEVLSELKQEELTSLEEEVLQRFWFGYIQEFRWLANRLAHEDYTILKPLEYLELRHLVRSAADSLKDTPQGLARSYVHRLGKLIERHAPYADGEKPKIPTRLAAKMVGDLQQIFTTDPEGKGSRLSKASCLRISVKCASEVVLEHQKELEDTHEALAALNSEKEAADTREEGGILHTKLADATRRKRRLEIIVDKLTITENAVKRELQDYPALRPFHGYIAAQSWGKK